MKELSIEQKAKRYDEAKYIMKEYLESGNAGIIAENTIRKAFPELAEPEDEKIKEELKKVLDKCLNVRPQIVEETQYIRLIAWLEKQGEQKPANWFQELEDKLANATPKQLAEWKEKYFKEEPAEWSEEDEAKLKSILFHIEDVENKNVIDWLKSLKDRVQPKQEILEKLEEWLDEYVSDLADVDTASLICSFTNYLDGKLPKSLKPQPQWKPSEQQLKTLQVAIDIIGEGTLIGTDLKELSEQLKKLREE
jgi:hypothetical protein